jgi:NADPH:quinone reductase-like Zn-dependent oxidoreductase
VLSLKPNKGLDDLTALVEAGKIMPSIDSVYPLADVPTALRRFGEASQNGKIILRMP